MAYVVVAYVVMAYISCGLYSCGLCSLAYTTPYSVRNLKVHETNSISHVYIHVYTPTHVYVHVYTDVDTDVYAQVGQAIPDTGDPEDWELAVQVALGTVCLHGCMAYSISQTYTWQAWFGRRHGLMVWDWHGLLLRTVSLPMNGVDNSGLLQDNPEPINNALTPLWKLMPEPKGSNFLKATLTYMNYLKVDPGELAVLESHTRVYTHVFTRVYAHVGTNSYTQAHLLRWSHTSHRTSARRLCTVRRQSSMSTPRPQTRS